MDLFGMAHQLKQAKDTIQSNPMGELRSRQQTARSDELHNKLSELSTRVAIIEMLLANVLKITPEQLNDIVAAHAIQMNERKTIEELKKETVLCPQCGRAVHNSLKTCQICGAQIKS
ncbi:MAG: zinc ribbon domain-containing protein [Planctomycetota bacterium]